MAKLLTTVPLNQCRVEKMRVRDGRVQEGCDFEFGIRIVLSKGVLLGLRREGALAGGDDGGGAGGRVCY